MNALENGIHVFERAGLGIAPFRIIGVGDKVGPIRYTDPKTGVTMECGSPGQPMGVCKFCGTGIRECWTIKSSDGKVFDVGCECVRKTGDAGMRKVVNAHKAKIAREKKKVRDGETIGWLDAAMQDENTRCHLRGLPHPRGFTDRTTGKPLTALDQADWMYKNAGTTGRVKLAKWIKSIIE